MTKKIKMLERTKEMKIAHKIIFLLLSVRTYESIGICAKHFLLVGIRDYLYEMRFGSNRKI